MRTIEEAKEFLTYHAPTAERIPRHEAIEAAFLQLLEAVWEPIPEGPGKTVAIRALGLAKMQCNSAIANQGN